jgi:hypothetical protein
VGVLRKLKTLAVLAIAVEGVYAYAAVPHAATSASGQPAAVAQGPVTVNASEALANKMAAAYGWTGGQATCLDELWTHESGFDAYAANSSSNARGIPQNINGWSAGYQLGNAGQQISWGLVYIKDRYGNPCAAWDFEMSHSPNWY